MLPAWIVLFTWLAIYPLVGWQQGTLWAAHLAAVVALGACALPRLWRQARVEVGVPALATLVALLSLALSLAVASARLPRREMEWAAVTGVAHALFFLICLCVVPVRADEEARSRHWLAALLVGVVLGQSLAVWGGITEPAIRPTGTLGNPNTLGAVAAACGLGLAGLWGLTPRSFLLVLLTLPLVLSTGSRGAVAALSVTLLLLAVRRRRWKLLTALAVVAALVVVVPNPLVERLQQLQPEHSFTRPFLWKTALRSIATNPLGIGPQMNQYVFPSQAWDADHPWLLHQRHSVGLTHNVLLTLALEWGWLAGAAALALTVWSVRRALRAPRRDARFGLGAALAATVLFLELQVDGLEENPIAFSLFLLLAACALSRIPPPTTRVGPALPGRLVASLLALALVALAGAGAWRTRGLVAARAADAGLAAYMDDHLDLEGARALVEKAEAALPGEEKVALLRCDLEKAELERRLDAEAPYARLAEAAGRARSALERARQVNPAEPSLPQREAALENEMRFRTGWGKDWQRSIDALQAVLALDPLDVEARWQLADIAHRAGLRGLRDEQIAIVFELEPDYALAWDGLARVLESDGDLEGALHAYVRAEEALLNCAIKVHFPEPGSSAFYRNNLETVDLPAVREHIRTLRQTLYF